MADNPALQPLCLDEDSDEWKSWLVFSEQWESYEVATGLNKKEAKIRKATLHAVLSKDEIRARRRLRLDHVDETDKQNAEAILNAWKDHFKPSRNVIYEISNSTSANKDQESQWKSVSKPCRTKQTFATSTSCENCSSETG